MRPAGASRVPPPEYTPQVLPEHLPDGCLSIAVFGPGKGEAIVVRLPDGTVGVVDGCREPTRGDPTGRGDPARELLHGLAEASGAPERFRLAFVCLTHPHADHYGGVGQLLSAFQGRVDQVWAVEHTSSHLMDALLAWTEHTYGGKRRMPDWEEVKGLERVLDGFHRARKEGESRLTLLSHGKPLLGPCLVDTHPLTITACGPADGDLDEAIKDLFAALQVVRKGRATMGKRFDVNRLSGAILLQWGGASVLLGGDLLRGTGPHSGWELARSRIDREVQIVNVAHHASEEAHDEALWTRMRPALSIVTPFMFGKKPNPPRPEQITALARTSVVAITSPPVWEGEPLRPKPMHPRGSPIRTFEPRNSALSLTPSNTGGSIRNAVAVAMDATGAITHFVLAGEADVYLAPDEAPLGRTARQEL
jgi:hypothetical protein